MSSSFPAAIVGQPVDRMDGRAKVTGAARYAAEFPVRDVVHVMMVQSTIASGRIRQIDSSAAQKLPGVLAIITHQNAQKLHEPPKGQDGRLGDPDIGVQGPEYGTPTGAVRSQCRPVELPADAVG